MGMYRKPGAPRKPSKWASRQHKKRAQKRKERFGGLAAFAMTNGGNRMQKTRMHRGPI